MKLAETLIALAIGTIVLVVAWRAHASLSRQDAVTQRLADRLQTFASAQLSLQRDIDARCREAGCRVEGDGAVLVLPGADEIRWELGKSGALTRNGKSVGLAVIAGAKFSVVKERTVATVRLRVGWAGEGVAWITHTWSLAVAEEEA